MAHPAGIQMHVAGQPELGDDGRGRKGESTGSRPTPSPAELAELEKQCGALKETQACNESICPPPHGPIPPGEAAVSQKSVQAINAVETKMAEMRREEDGTVTQTTVTVTKEIAQPKMNKRPWGMVGMSARGIFASAIENGHMKDWAVFAQVIRFTSCVPFGGNISSCATAKSTQMCLKMDITDIDFVKLIGHNLTKAEEIHDNPKLLQKAKAQPGGEECDKLHEALIALA